MTTINQLNAADTINISDLLPIYSQQNGDARKVSAYQLAQFVAGQITVPDDKITQYSAPALTGFTTQVNDASDSVWLIMMPTGTMAAGTIKLPAVANAANRQEVLVNCTQIVTALTVDGNGATVTGAPSTLAANAFFRLRYESTLKTWYRVG